MADQTMTTTIENGKRRAPHRRDRTAVLLRKMERKAVRDKVLSDALHSRVAGVLQRLVDNGAIKWHLEKGKRPADPRIMVTYLVGRKGTVKPIERSFVAATDQQVARIVPRETMCAVILITPEMRDERIAERISALFNN